uniref:Putative N-acetyltransferase yoaA n=1 Tax=Aegilops tauschii TaxID=37682 RepID=M8BPE7_AEGTA
MDPDGDARHQQRRRQEEEEGPVVSLRPLGLADVDDFMAWASDDRVMRHLKRPLCHTREQAVAQIGDTVLGHPWFRAICVTGRPVGQVSVWPYPDDGGHRANLGYALAHEHWGRGIASAAIRMVARNAGGAPVVGRVFEELPGLGRLEAVTDVGNVRSQRALEKAGFQREGVLRSYIVRPGAGAGEAGDAAVYSFLSSDPRPPLA